MVARVLTESQIMRQIINYFHPGKLIQFKNIDTIDSIVHHHRGAPWQNFSAYATGCVAQRQSLSCRVLCCCRRRSVFHQVFGQDGIQRKQAVQQECDLKMQSPAPTANH